MTQALLDGLGLAQAVDAEGLLSGRKTFGVVHAGQHDVRIGTALDLIRTDPDLLPPRTGHLGNWADIAAGRAGPMDFNTAICGERYGFPLIYGFTRTEAREPGGDQAYQPGSSIIRGQRRDLSLHTWNGERFQARDHERPLFCPLVLAEVGGELVPLVEVHWQQMLGTADYPFVQWAQALTARAGMVTDMLTLLLEQAGAQGRTQAFAELISHSVRLDGQVGRCDLQPDGAGFVLDGYRYPSARSLAEATMLTVGALAEPRWFFDHLREMPAVLPVMSLQVTNVLFAELGMHRRAWREGRVEAPLITHLHWGARAMAGCPPKRNGYLVRRSTVRSLRAISDPLVEHFAAAQPAAFVLLPAQVFALCPPSTSPQDLELMGLLVKTIASTNPDGAHAAALHWLEEQADQFSPYFRGRFQLGAGVPADGRRRKAAHLEQPEGFTDLTFRQACAAVAAFEEVLS